MRHLALLACLALSVSSLPACAAADDGDEADEGDDAVSDTAEPLTSGVNGGACAASPYNCKLRVRGGNRVDSSNADLWGVQHDVAVDGNGFPLGTTSIGHMMFNYGQTRRIHGRTYAYAMSTGLESSGWFPIDAIKSEPTFRSRVGEVNAKDPGRGHLGCYEVRRTQNATLAEKKVVFDADSSHEKAGDYLPRLRPNGRIYVNMAFNVPGFSLGGAAVDLWPAGTKFRRVDVPTSQGKPSIDIPLWVKDGAGRYRKRSGSMKFIYGYVRSETGDRRFGWIPYEALSSSDNCP